MTASAYIPQCTWCRWFERRLLGMDVVCLHAWARENKPTHWWHVICTWLNWGFVQLLLTLWDFSWLCLDLDDDHLMITNSKSVLFFQFPFFNEEKEPTIVTAYHYTISGLMEESWTYYQLFFLFFHLKLHQNVYLEKINKRGCPQLAFWFNPTITSMHLPLIV